MIGIRYRYSANKRILIISAYFHAAACDKRMRLQSLRYSSSCMTNSSCTISKLYNIKFYSAALVWEDIF